MAIHHSTLAALKRCPMKFKYAYIDRLESKHESLPLKRGIWLHFMLACDALRRGLDQESLLEVPDTIEAPDGKDLEVRAETGALRHPDKDAEYPLTWQGALAYLEEQVWAWLPDEAKADLVVGGQTLPESCANIFRGYLWQHRNDFANERPLLVEHGWSRTDNAGAEPVEYAGRLDLLVAREGRVVVRDWKTTKSLPSASYRLRERQRLLYAWGIELTLGEHADALEAQGLKPAVAELELDFLLTKTPTKPTQNKDGSLSKRKIDTTPGVYFEALKEYGIPLDDHHREVINRLERDNAFYKRFPIPYVQKALVRALQENAQVADLARQLQKSPGAAYRVEDRSCDFLCDFLPLCEGEAYGSDVSSLKRQLYQIRPKATRPTDIEATEE